jgi:hypothetical protein
MGSEAAGQLIRGIISATEPIAAVRLRYLDRLQITYFPGLTRFPCI